jgi:hypothetical protein
VGWWLGGLVPCDLSHCWNFRSCAFHAFEGKCGHNLGRGPRACGFSPGSPHISPDGWVMGEAGQCGSARPSGGDRTIVLLLRAAVSGSTWDRQGFGKELGGTRSVQGHTEG